MELNHAMDTLHALSQETRLKIFRLLVKSGLEGLQAGEIARKVAAPQNTVSTHLALLARAGLVKRTRKGREIIYAPELAAIHDLVLFLTQNCCEGRPELCGPIIDDLTLPISQARKMEAPVYHILFLCTGNSARSILAEAIMNRLGKGHFIAYSAGSHPMGKINPFALNLLQQLKFPATELRSKNWDEFAAPDAPPLDFIFTVCDNAAGEVCPIWPGQPMTAHWGIPDPAMVEGSDTQKALAFNEAFRQLETRINCFINLPLEAIGRLSLKKHVDEIGNTSTAMLELQS